MPKISSVVSSCYHLFSEHQQLSNETTMTNPVSRRIVHKEYGISLKSVPVWLATAKTPLLYSMADIQEVTHLLLQGPQEWEAGAEPNTMP